MLYIGYIIFSSISFQCQKRFFPPSNSPWSDSIMRLTYITGVLAALRVAGTHPDVLLGVEGLLQGLRKLLLALGIWDYRNINLETIFLKSLKTPGLFTSLSFEGLGPPSEVWPHPVTKPVCPVISRFFVGRQIGKMYLWRGMINDLLDIIGRLPLSACIVLGWCWVLGQNR